MTSPTPAHADGFLTIGEISEQVEARRAALARAAA